MPAYDYQCECGEVIERTYPMTKQPKKVKCPVCGKMAKKAFSMPSIKCVYSYYERSAGNPRATRGRGH